MSELFGYMLTWTTYGTWLPGDPRGYVEDGCILSGDMGLQEFSKKQQKYPMVKLDQQEKQIVHDTILLEAEQIGQRIEAIIVHSNHVHLLARPHEESIEKIANRYKSITTRALWQQERKGKIWSGGFDKRFCFSENDMNRRKEYILKHTS